MRVEVNLLPFQNLCRSMAIPIPEPEYRFAPPRRWRIDWAWPTHKVALEVEGGVWSGGRHTRGKGFLGDCEKYNTLACMGWRLIRVTPQMMDKGDVFDWLHKIFKEG